MKSERGIAVVLAMMAILLLAGLGSAIVLTTSTESLIAANFRNGIATRHAVSAMAQLSLASLSAEADWNAVLSGAVVAAFADGAPDGVRILSDGTPIDLSRVVNLARCGKGSSCSDSEMDASTFRRPWGTNNPRWQLYAYGYLPQDASATFDQRGAFYVISMVADDGLEIDGDPFRDAEDAGELGAGLVLLRVEAFGPRGAHSTAELTIGRSMASTAQVLLWREPA